MGLGLLSAGLLSLIFGGWAIVPAVVLVLGVVATVVSVAGESAWTRSGTERTAALLAVASEQMLARVDTSYAIMSRRPVGWVRLAATVLPRGESAYRTTLGELFVAGEAVPGDGAVIVVARAQRDLPDVRLVRAPDAGWRALLNDPAVTASFPAPYKARNRPSWDTRMAAEAARRSWQKALTVAVGALFFVAGIALIQVLGGQ